MADANKDNEIIDAVTDIAKGHSDVYKKGFDKLGENILQKHMPVKDAVGIDDQTAEKVYAQAYQLYNMGKYSDAHTLFSSLILIDVTEPKYILGLAACSHMLKNYDEAAGHYMQCAALDIESPIPYFHAYDCFMEMNDISSAMIALSMTIKRSGEKQEYQDMKNKATVALESLREQVKSGKIKPTKEIKPKKESEESTKEAPELEE